MWLGCLVEALGRLRSPAVLWLGASLAVNFAFFATGEATGQQLPRDDTQAHLGVESCGGSVCHDAAQPWPTSPVTQNEYSIWKQQDRHSRAYATLTTAESARIARNLGIADPTGADICLDCHADNVAPAVRGPSFDIAEGVGCEACHGGSADWAGPHADGFSWHKSNTALGLYPTADPVALAALCISCHVGSEGSFPSHRLYGAGHPRLAFELDTFLVRQPMHAQVDVDYLLRKPPANGAKYWAIGQIATAHRLAVLMSEAPRLSDGAFPELAFYDCAACHHRMTDWPAMAVRTSPNPKPRLNAASFVMATAIAASLVPDLAMDVQRGSMALRAAAFSDMADLNEAAMQLVNPLNMLLSRTAEFDFDGSERNAVLRALLETGANGSYRDFSDAEQVVMALAALIAASRGDSVRPMSAEGVTARYMEMFYSAAADAGRFDPITFRAVFEKVTEVCGDACRTGGRS